MAISGRDEEVPYPIGRLRSRTLEEAAACLSRGGNQPAAPLPGFTAALKGLLDVLARCLPDAGEDAGQKEPAEALEAFGRDAGRFRAGAGRATGRLAGAGNE